MHKFRELVVWQKAMDLTTQVYQYTENLPSTEKFGLISELRRSTISICSNIAEGAGRNSKGESQLELLNRLKYLEDNVRANLFDEIEIVQKMLFNLMKSLK